MSSTTKSKAIEVLDEHEEGESFFNGAYNGARGAASAYTSGVLDAAAAQATTSAAKTIASMAKIENPAIVEALKAVVPILAASLGGALDIEHLEAGGIRAARAMGTIHGDAVLAPAREMVTSIFGDLIKVGAKALTAGSSDASTDSDTPFRSRTRKES